jgi:hydroxylamine reductase
MYCFQCQEASKNVACTVAGVCGKQESTSNLQDVLVYAARGLAVAASKQSDLTGDTLREVGRRIVKALFTTVTNVSFDDQRIAREIYAVLETKRSVPATQPEIAAWHAGDMAGLYAQIPVAAVTSEENEDLRALKELALYGLKGIAAYTDHALVLGYEEEDLYREIIRLLAGTAAHYTDRNLTAEEATQLVLDTGNAAVQAMALLDRANTETYGNPEISEVNLGTRNRPGILISGHDLRDLQELLEQTKDTGIDIYTHGEMLPAHYYPTFKKYEHFVGNYGNSWWLQDKEFAAFNGPIVMTTNCLTPPRASYRDRLFTTGLVAFPGIKHIGDRPGNAGGLAADSAVAGADDPAEGSDVTSADGRDAASITDPASAKDFSAVIELAKTCPPPTELETGTITGGFAHAQVTALADTVVEAVKSGAIRKFVVMGGCDGRQNGRSYFTEMAEALPENTVILTAGCAKFRYNKLDLGTIGGIPRVLDAGQCNDSYSLAMIALKLKEVFELDDINDLPIDFDIAWYEQKAITVLLALLALGFKGVRIGPTLPAFLSPAVAKVLVETFDLKLIDTVEKDLAAITA